MKPKIIKYTVMPFILLLLFSIFFSCGFSHLRIDAQKKPVIVNKENISQYATLETTDSGGVRLVIHAGVERIADEAFRDLELVEVIIPETVVAIGKFAFAGNQLTQLSLPRSVISLQEGAFEGNQLAHVIIPQTFTEELRFGHRVFDNNPASMTAVVDRLADNTQNAAADAIARMESRDCIAYQLFPPDTQFELHRSGIPLDIPLDIHSTCVVTAPTVTLAPTASTSIEVSWTTVEHASGYEVSWGTDTGATGGAGSPVAVSGATQYTITSLAANTLYYVKVRATGRGGYQRGTYSSSTSANTNQVVPMVPVVVVSVQNVMANSITITWAPLAGALSYEVSWGTAQGATNGAGSPTLVSGTSHTITSLTANAINYLKVRANGISSVYSVPIKINKTIPDYTTITTSQGKGLYIHNTVTLIGDRQFLSQTLISVSIPTSVTQIGELAFSENRLTNLSIPNSVNTIGDDAFSRNRLSTVTFGSGISTIPERAFSRNRLTSLTIPSTVTQIEKSAFSENRLTSLTIPNSVHTIGEYAFSTNTLSSLRIPDSVTTIGAKAFQSNPKLTSVSVKDRAQIDANPTNPKDNGIATDAFSTGTVFRLRDSGRTITRP